MALDIEDIEIGKFLRLFYYVHKVTSKFYRYSSFYAHQ